MVSVVRDQAEVFVREPVAESVGPFDHIEVQQVRSGLMMVALHGMGDLALMTAVADELRFLAPTGHIMVDLCGVTIVDLAAIDVLVSSLDDASGDMGEFCFLCSRLTSRLLLHRSGVADHVPIFATPGDAQQALVHRQEGYGIGWCWSAERRRSRQQSNDLSPDIQTRRAWRDAARQARGPRDVPQAPPLPTDGRGVGPPPRVRTAPEAAPDGSPISRPPSDEAASG